MGKINLEENLKTLEEISKKLESDSIDLEESLKLFEKGINVYRKSVQEINSIKEKVKILVNEEEIDFDDQGESIE